MSRAVLILGATSPIARAAAALLAKRGDRLLLASSDELECRRLAEDLKIRFQATVFSRRYDALDSSSNATLIEATEEQLGGLDALLVAVGDLGNGPNTLESAETARLIQVNFTGLASIIGTCAQRMAIKGSGLILGVASVAGDRGRQSNFVYGSAKGGFALYLQGLRNLMYPKGVRVVTFKPGFVDTGMTYGKDGTFLVASPADAGRAIVKAMDTASGVVYFPWFWRWIMGVILIVPEPLFKRLKL